MLQDDDYCVATKENIDGAVGRALEGRTGVRTGNYLRWGGRIVVVPGGFSGGTLRFGGYPCEGRGKS